MKTDKLINFFVKNYKKISKMTDMFFVSIFMLESFYLGYVNGNFVMILTGLFFSISMLCKKYNNFVILRNIGFILMYTQIVNLLIDLFLNLDADLFKALLFMVYVVVTVGLSYVVFYKLLETKKLIDYKIYNLTRHPSLDEFIN